jgi:hypothetical protein
LFATLSKSTSDMNRSDLPKLSLSIDKFCELYNDVPKVFVAYATQELVRGNQNLVNQSVSEYIQSIERKAENYEDKIQELIRSRIEKFK